MRLVQSQQICSWLAPADQSAAVEGELERLGVSYFRSEGRYVWRGGSALAVRYVFRAGPSILEAQAAFDRLVAAGVQLLGEHELQSPFDGGIRL